MLCEDTTVEAIENAPELAPSVSETVAEAAPSASEATSPHSRDDVSTRVSETHLLQTSGSSRTSRGLTSLDLSHNRLTTSGAAVLASVLVDPKSRNAMRILDLSQNYIA